MSAVIIANVGQGSAQSRDAERRADLRNLQSALELYKLKNSRYPAGCKAVGEWSGQQGTVYQCSGGSTQYIVGLAPEFIKTLPTDPKLNGTDSGYVYTTNAAGTVYKLMVKKTVESETVTYANEFKSCEIAPGYCDATVAAGYNKPTNCEEGNSVFMTSYAVWAGYPFEPDTNPLRIERERERVICDIP